MTELTLRPGDRIDRYEVVALLGQGGMADVLHVRHAELGTDHALKVLRVVVPGLHERLLQEGRIQAALQHPNVVAVTDLVREGGRLGLVMERVRGPSLDQLLRAYQPSPAQADVLARGLLAGVAAAHERGLVHRDLKPGNVLLAVGERGLVPKVTDFGLARALDDPEAGGRRTRTGATLGTPAFMAPEQLRNARAADQRSDVFALGAILYELVSGVPAFTGEDLIALYEQTSQAKFRPVRQVAPQAPERMERAIHAALTPDPAARPPSVQALLALWADGTAAQADAWEPAHLSLVAGLTGAPAGAGTLTPEAAPARLAPAPVPSPSSEDLDRLFLPSQAEDPDPEPPEPIAGRWPWLGLGLGAGLVGAGVIGAGLVAAGAWAGWGAGAEPSAPDASALHDGAFERPALRAPAPDEPAATDPAPDDPAPHAAPDPDRGAVDPVRGAVVPAAPTAPRPAPPVTPRRPDPAPAPSPWGATEPPAPAPAPLALAQLTVEGAPGGFLVDRDHGGRQALGAVPPGAYWLYVTQAGAEPVRVMLVRLEPGDARVIRCRGAFCQ